MTITIEELRKVYEDGYMQGDADGANTIHPHEAAQAFHDAALLAVARYVAERQRAVEPTKEMEAAAIPFLDQDDDLRSVYRAMSAVAPLVVPE